MPLNLVSVAPLLPSYFLPLLSGALMNAEFIAVRIRNDGGAAPRRRDERLKGEWHFVLFEVFDRCFEIIHLQHNVWTIARWFQERFLPHGERVRSDLILEPEAVPELHGSRAREPENDRAKSVAG
jgi:hypothetical protein